MPFSRAGFTLVIAASIGCGQSGGGTNTDGGPSAGNPNGMCSVPSQAQAADISMPTTVVGNGMPSSCMSDAVVAAVAAGGVITFNCGPNPITITLTQTAKIFNDTGPNIVIDGGGLVTLSGGNNVRILYMDTCDQAQHWTTSHCDNQDSPNLTVQNLTFVDGNSMGQDNDGGGGGAIFVRGGQFKVLNSRFFHNVCESSGPDLGGGAIRVLAQYNNQQVFVVNSTFGGTGMLGNVCSNGGALSSIGVSYTVINSLFVNNQAIGSGANPAQSGTPGGGSGGAIYNDGNTYTLTLCGDVLNGNTAVEGGGAILYVSNDHAGSLFINKSTLTNNHSSGFETMGYPGIFVQASGPPQISNSTLQ